MLCKSAGNKWDQVARKSVFISVSSRAQIFLAAHFLILLSQKMVQERPFPSFQAITLHWCDVNRLTPLDNFPHTFKNEEKDIGTSLGNQEIPVKNSTWCCTPRRIFFTLILSHQVW